MTGSVFFRPVDGSADQYEWVMLDEFGNPGAASRGSLQELIENSNGCSAIMVFDAGLVHITSAEIPGRSLQQIRQVARYALEDEIADDVEDTEVVLGPVRNGTRVVALLNRKRLESSIAPVVDHGVEIEQIVLDAWLIPRESNEISIMIDLNRYCIKYGELYCTSIDRISAPLVLARLVRQHHPATVRIYAATDTAPKAEELMQIKSACAPATVEVQTFKENALLWLARQFDPSSTPSAGFDLLPEKIRHATDNHRTHLTYKIAAGIFALALTAHISLDWYDVSRKKSALQAIKSAQEETFRTAFPEIRRVVNAEAQSQQLLAELREQGPPPADFLKVLHSSAAILERDDLGITLTGLTFADGVLLLRTESPDMERIEKYRAALTEKMIAEVVTAESSGDGIRGAIRVRAGDQ